MPDLSLCSRCGTKPRAGRHSWCTACQAQRKREARKERRAEGQRAIAQAGVAIKKSNHAPAILETGWVPTFLEQLRKTGGLFKAAEIAGTTPQTVRRWRAQYPEFEEAIQDCRDRHADDLEEELEEMGRESKGKNPVPHIVRLKALRPDQYIEKSVALSFTAEAQITAEEGLKLVSRLVDNLTPATLALISSSPKTLPLEAPRCPALSPQADPQALAAGDAPLEAPPA